MFPCSETLLNRLDFDFAGPRDEGYEGVGLTRDWFEGVWDIAEWDGLKEAHKLAVSYKFKTTSRTYTSSTLPRPGSTNPSPFPFHSNPHESYYHHHRRDHSSPAGRGLPTA